MQSGMGHRLGSLSRENQSLQFSVMHGRLRVERVHRVGADYPVGQERFL